MFEHLKSILISNDNSIGLAKLHVNDKVKLELEQFSENEQLFEITDINTYLYDHNIKAEFTLKGKSGVFYLSEKNDNQFTLRKKLSNTEIAEIFNFKQLTDSLIYAKPLIIEAIPDSLLQWLVKDYTAVTNNEERYCFDDDYRQTNLPNYKGGPGIEFSEFVADNEHGIEIEVFDNGEIEILAALYKPYAKFSKVRGI